MTQGFPETEGKHGDFLIVYDGEWDGANGNPTESDAWPQSIDDEFSFNLVCIRLRLHDPQSQ